MKNPISILAMAIAFGFFFSCNNDDDSTPSEDTTIVECVFEQIDDNMDGLIDDDERAIMEECMNNSLSSSFIIKPNMIGTWNLIGHGEGWIPTISQPCSSMVFTEEDLTFNFTNAWNDTTIVTTWDVLEGIAGPTLVWEGNLPDVNISTVCSQYMFGNQTEFDGNMYLYEKIK